MQAICIQNNTIMETGYVYGWELHAYILWLPNLYQRPLNAKYNSKYINQSPKFPIKVMIWGCFSAKSAGWINGITGFIKSDNYIETLESKLLPSIRSEFGE